MNLSDIQPVNGMVRACDDGTFSLEVPQQATALLVAHQDYAPSRLQPVPAVGTDGSVEADVDLIRGGTIRGCVRDASGQPLAKAHVVAMQGNAWPYSTRSAADGSFELARVEPGSYVMRFAAAREDERDGSRIDLQGETPLTVVDKQTVRVELGTLENRRRVQEGQQSLIIHLALRPSTGVQ